jgi:lysozyme family protein
MKQNFERALAKVLQYEGGWSNNPHDPGQQTMKGVTQRTYDAFRAKTGQDRQGVRSITKSELETIYRREFWDRVKGDELPAGVDLVTFDTAVNSGPSRAAKLLQQVVGTTIDGIIGPKTLAAVRAHGPELVIYGLCTERLNFLTRLRTWNVFAKGWQSRVRGVERTALSWASEKPAAAVEADPASADGQDAARAPTASPEAAAAAPPPQAAPPAQPSQETTGMVEGFLNGAKGALQSRTVWAAGIAFVATLPGIGKYLADIDIGATAEAASQVVASVSALAAIVFRAQATKQVVVGGQR